MNLRWVTPPSDLPATGARIPVWSVRAALLAFGVLLSVVDYGVSGWLAVGIVLSVASAWAPELLLPWGLILFLAAGQLHRHPDLSWQLLVLVAGLHLLHVLAVFSLELPWRGWVQPAVFRLPLLRFLAIEVPCQLFAVLALVLLAPRHSGHRPLTVAELAVVGAAALVCLALLLLGTRGKEERPPPAR